MLRRKSTATTNFWLERINYMSTQDQQDSDATVPRNAVSVPERLPSVNVEPSACSEKKDQSSNAKRAGSI